MIFISFSIEEIITPALTVPPLSHLTPCTPTHYILYIANPLAAALNEPALYRLLTFQVPNPISYLIAYVVPNDQSRSEAVVSVW